MRDPQRTAERIGIVRQRHLAVARVLLEVQPRVRAHQAAEVGHQLRELALGLAPAYHQGPRDLEGVIGVEGGGYPLVGRDHVGAGLLAVASTSRHWLFIFFSYFESSLSEGD